VSYSLALGPFHPAWRGAQRFVFRINGERISDIEYYDGFNERGCAERLPRVELSRALLLVSHVCGTCSVAHSLAFCQALERLAGLSVSDRAAFLRSIIAEFERVASHLDASANLLNIIGLESRARELFEQREVVLEGFHTLTGARMAPDILLPGGLRHDLSAANRESLLVLLPKINRALYRFIDTIIDNRPLLARVFEVGALPRTAAEQFGVRGPLARASGITRDVRSDQPYAAYAKLNFQPITQEGGDIYARLVQLLLEAYESVKLIEQALEQLPSGDAFGDLPASLPAGSGTGVVEGPRGLIRYAVTSDGQRISNVQIDAPRQLDRLLARTLLTGALIDNAVAIIASTDHCTACAER
jgi:ech hydrogenase subunit E